MKRVIALFMTALMVVLMLPAKAYAATENVTITVTADKSVAMRGDTVNFSVAIGAVESLGGLEFKLDVPEGLTIVDSSISLPDGLDTTLDSDGPIVVPTSGANDYKWSYSAQSTGYKGTSNLTILNFACTVDTDSAYEAKNVTITFEKPGDSTWKGCCFDNINLDEHNVTVVPATVTVSKAPVYVSGVTLDKTSLSLKDGETAALVATIQPSDADNQTLIWSSSDSSVATVTNGTVTAVKAGTATITVTTQDGNKTASCTVTVSCNHSLSKVEAKEATCGQAGNIEYYTCSKCSKKFSDANGTTEVTKTEIPATGKHTEEIRNKVDATEDAPGYTGDTYCSVCDTKLASGTEIPQLPHTHKMKHIDKVDATCETDGNIEYYECTKCGKTYADEAGTKEVTDIVIPATGHTVTGDWVSDENNHWKVCDVCNEKVDEAAHTYHWVLDKAATLDATGLKHEECECGAVRSENTVIAQLTHEHTGVHHDAVAATCTKTGTVEYYSCEHEDCTGKYYSDEACQLELADITVAINPDNHVYDNDADAYCNECDYQRYYVVVSGGNSTYTKNSANGVTIKVDGDLSLLDSVKVDGKVISAGNYTVADNNVELTLKNTYLNSLSSTTHSVEFIYSDGKTSKATITVKDAAVANNGGNNNAAANNNNTDSVRSPKTGEPAVGGFVVSLVVCIGLLGLFVWRKKSVNETVA